jgi:hypothetical protein
MAAFIGERRELPAQPGRRVDVELAVDRDDGHTSCYLDIPGQRV